MKSRRTLKDYLLNGQAKGKYFSHNFPDNTGHPHGPFEILDIENYGTTTAFASIRYIFYSLGNGVIIKDFKMCEDLGSLILCKEAAPKEVEKARHKLSIVDPIFEKSLTQRVLNA